MRVPGFLRCVAALSVAVVAACAADDRPRTANVTTVAALARMRPEASALLARAANAPAHVTNEGFAFAAPQSHGPWTASSPLRVSVGARASDPTTFRVAGVDIHVSRPGAGDVLGALDQGALVRAEVTPGLDVVTFDRGDGLEELLVVHAGGGSTWELDARDGTTLRALADDLVEVRDAHGAPRLRLRADVGWDANGHRFRPRLRVDGRTVALVLPHDLAFPAVVDPVWLTAGHPLRGHAMGTATLLPDGTVYLHGGCQAPADSSTTDVCTVATMSEAFDPMGGTFVAAPVAIETGFRRMSHTATPLADGRVFIVGGFDPHGDPRGDAQIYAPHDPLKDAPALSTSVVTLKDPRGNHAATRLASGHVLVVGGTNRWASGTALATAEEIDTKAGTKTTATMHVARAQPRIARLPSGDVFVASDASYEIYRTATQTFDPVAAIPGMTTVETVTVLADGNVAVTGHTDATTDVHVLTIDPTSGATVFDLVAPSQRTAGWSSALLPSGALMLVGAGIGGATPATDVLDVVAKTFTTVDELPGDGGVLTVLADGRVLYGGTSGDAQLFDRLTVTGAGHSAESAHATLLDRSTTTLLPGGKVLVAGGLDVSGAPTSAASLYDPRSDTLTATGSMTTPRGMHSAVLLPSGKVLVAGGVIDTSGTATDGTEIFDPATGAFVAGPKMSRPRCQTSMSLAPWGQVIVFGGSTVSCAKGAKQDATSAIDRFDPASATFQPEAKSAIGRRLALLTPLLDGRLLVTGGIDADGFPLAQAEIFDAHMTSTVFPLHQPRFDHTATVLADGRVLLAGGTTSFEPVVATESIEALDPIAKLSVPVGALHGQHYGHAAKLLPSGQLLVIGGLATGPATSDVQLFDPRSGLVVELAHLQHEIFEPIAFLDRDDLVLVSGAAAQAIERWTGGSPLAALRPTLTDGEVDVTLGADTDVKGSGLDGASESNAGGTHDAGANVPVAVWLPFGDLPPQFGGMHDWSATQTKWHVEDDWPHGWGWLRVVTAGAPSIAESVHILGIGLTNSCKRDTDCVSGACEDGICCATRCAPCQACIAELKIGPGDGTCGPVRAGVVHDRSIDGAAPVGDCLQSDPLTCGFDGTCDGAGNCANWPNGTHCGVGAACEGGACTAIAHATCDGDHTLTNADGTTADCTPFACTKDGTCVARCASAVECAQGYRCDADGACVQPTSTSIEDRGCGCEVVGAPTSRTLASFVGGLIAVVLLRRRRRAC